MYHYGVGGGGQSMQHVQWGDFFLKDEMKLKICFISESFISMFCIFVSMTWPRTCSGVSVSNGAEAPSS